MPFSHAAVCPLCEQEAEYLPRTLVRLCDRHSAEAERNRLVADVLAQWWVPAVVESEV